MSIVSLFHLLTYPGTTLVTIKGVRGYLQSVQREDGSGRSFNVTLMLGDGTKKTVYVRVK